MQLRFCQIYRTSCFRRYMGKKIEYTSTGRKKKIQGPGERNQERATIHKHRSLEEKEEAKKDETETKRMKMWRFFA